MIISIIDSNLNYWHQDGKILIVMLYIDDLIIIIGNFEEKIDRLTEQLARGFNMMDLG
jgi:hypothetical protein